MPAGEGHSQQSQEAFFDELGLSNSRLEALNPKIRLISHRSYGFYYAPRPEF